MGKDRLVSFSDAVIAIVITIMVLELKAPHSFGINALAEALPDFLSYFFSFVFLTIYWINHHWFFQSVERADDAMLWTNMCLLFWLCLIPFVTSWMGNSDFARIPTALYGLVLLMSTLTGHLLRLATIRAQPPDSPAARVPRRDLKAKLSLGLYMVGTALAFVDGRIAAGTYLLAVLPWIKPTSPSANS
jgi:uncharacterized membrane protein